MTSLEKRNVIKAMDRNKLGLVLVKLSNRSKRIYELPNWLNTSTTFLLRITDIFPNDYRHILACARPTHLSPSYFIPRMSEIKTIIPYDEALIKYPEFFI